MPESQSQTPEDADLMSAATSVTEQIAANNEQDPYTPVAGNESSTEVTASNLTIGRFGEPSAASGTPLPSVNASEAISNTAQPEIPAQTQEAAVNQETGANITSIQKYRIETTNADSAWPDQVESNISQIRHQEKLPAA